MKAQMKITEEIVKIVVSGDQLTVQAVDGPVYLMADAPS